MSSARKRPLLFAALLLAASLAGAPIASGQHPSAPSEPDSAPTQALAQEEPKAGQEGKKNPSEEPQQGQKNGKKPSTEKGNEGKKNPDEGEKKEPSAEDESKDKEKNGDKDKDKGKETWYSVHGQGTIVSQGNWKFRSPYEGTNSFRSILNYRTSETATLFLAAGVCEGGSIVFNPEVSGGRGLSDVFGIAGFPNGEITRVGKVEPTPYFARLYYQQVFGLGGDQEKVEDASNVIAGMRDVERITVRLGKMAAADQFDDNAYSHDPRTQFLDWAIMYNGAWDYPANVRGYTYGATVEFNEKDWALRYGIFGEPSVANGQEIDPRFLQANGHILELEERYTVEEHPGKLRLMAYLNNAHMGNYRVSLREMPSDPDIALTRAYRAKYGFGVNVEQEITKDLGAFARIGWNDGHTESWAFTEIDATLAGGVLLKGTCWSRPQDQVGFAGAINGISNGHRDYLAAGGLGFILGDGRLRYGPEEILEAYYNWELRKGINVTFDFEGVNDPGYNRDRGPIAIAAIRVHFEY
ncbi:MAG: carbohydrate porin [Gemmataceae bacterium]